MDKPTERDDEWLKAQEQIEAARRKKEDENRQHGGKSLYEVLQANKGVCLKSIADDTCHACSTGY